MGWDVKLSRDAERALRSSPVPVQRRIGGVLDGLERGGLPPEAWSDPSAEGVYRIPAGDRLLLVRLDAGSRVALVVRIDAEHATAADAAVGVLPLPARVRSRVAAWASDGVADVRYALRSFRRSPLFTAVVVLTLAVGLGGATAIFGVVNTVFRSALPFGEGERLVRLRNYAITADGQQRGYNMTRRDFHAIRDDNRVFDGVVAQEGSTVSLLGGEGAERVSVIGVSEGWAEVLRVRPLLGRAFGEEEAALGGASGSALLSYGLWQRQFGGDRDVVGRTLPYDGGAYTVVGVMPAGFSYPYDADLWVPRRFDATEWRSHDLNVVARMRDGITVEAVRSDMARLYAALLETQPEASIDAGIEVTTSRSDFIREEARILNALLAAVIFLLLLACVNVANMLTARFVTRGTELGIRAALGAGRRRQLRQLLTETLLLFAAGGLGGVLLTIWLGDFLSVLIPDVMRTQLSLDGLRMDPAVLGFASGLSVVAGLVFGAAAALRGGRSDVQSLLREGARAGASRSGRRFQDGLVVAQLALSLVLLVGAGLLVDHFQRLQRFDLGFRPEGLATLRVTLQQERYAEPEARLALLRTLEARIAAEPEVEAVGITTVNPLCCGDWGASIEVEGRPPSPDGAPLLIHHRYVTPDFFQAMGIPIVRGSGFDAAEGPDAAPTIIVDEPLARRFWPGEDPVGKRIRRASADAEWRTVVGVVPWVEKEGDYTESWYYPYYQDPAGRGTEDVHFMVRVRGEAGIDAARRAIAEVDPALAVWGVNTMPALRRDRLAQDRLGALVAALFAGFGLVLAGFGLYGLLTYVVELRSPEIGTRIALGASRRNVLGLVLKQAGRRVALGLLVGLGLALALNRVLQGIVAGIGWIDPAILLPLLLLLALVATIAAGLPALRAARVDPVRAFRG